MEAEILPIKNLLLPKVNFYTIHVEGREVPEYIDFVRRLKNDPKTLLATQEIDRIIRNMGRKFGAQEREFRHERFAHALPGLTHHLETEYNDDQGIRLYCLRLSKSLVVLFNGDRKTNQDPELCPLCLPHFRLANKVADAFQKCIVSKDIQLDHDYGYILPDGYILTF